MSEHTETIQNANLNMLIGTLRFGNALGRSFWKRCPGWKQLLSGSLPDRAILSDIRNRYFRFCCPGPYNSNRKRVFNLIRGQVTPSKASYHLNSVGSLPLVAGLCEKADDN